MSPNLIICGTGRCGTGFYAQTLTAAGIPCTHEQYFTYNGDRSLHTRPDHTPDSSWMAAPYLHKHSAPTVQAIRDPEAVVTSLLGIRFFETPGPYRQFAHVWEPKICRQPPAIAAWMWWIAWNRRIEPFAEVAINIDGNWAEGLALATTMTYAIPSVTPKQLRRAARQVGHQYNARERADLNAVYDGVPEELVTEAYDLWSELSACT